MSYIETSNLDGETNLKIRQVILVKFDIFVVHFLCFVRLLHLFT